MTQPTEQQHAQQHLTSVSSTRSASVEPFAQSTSASQPLAVQAPASQTPALTAFPAQRTAALQRLRGVDPQVYERTRNWVDGAVTRLSPYITHDLISPHEAVTHARDVLGLADEHKLIFEYAWRAYFHHVWAHVGEQGLFTAAHDTQANGYNYDIPHAVLTGNTGIAVVDHAVHELYETGYLHNHLRLWLASYLVHCCKVHWATGARWMYAHLLDGDLASNTLSWQWVAGTWTGKPYVFNNDNVAKYAPALSQPGSALDVSYEDINRIAQSHNPLQHEHLVLHLDQVVEPPRTYDALQVLGNQLQIGWQWIDILGALDDQPIELRHPWSLGTSPYESVSVSSLTLDAAPAVQVGMIVTEFHTQYHWSAPRWAFVWQGMQETTLIQVAASLEEWMEWLNHRATKQRASRQPTSKQSTAVKDASTVLTSMQHTLNPHYAALCLHPAVQVWQHPSPFAQPPTLKRSFSSYWNAVQGKSANYFKKFTP